MLFKVIFCLFVVLGCTIQLEAVLDFSDALVFLICVPNLIGLYVLAPVVQRRLDAYPAQAALISADARGSTRRGERPISPVSGTCLTGV